MLIFREVKALVERQEVDVDVDVDGEPGSVISACRGGQVRPVLLWGIGAYFVQSTASTEYSWGPKVCLGPGWGRVNSVDAPGDLRVIHSILIID